MILDTGHGHIGRNETGEPARDVTVIFAPVALPFRGELPGARAALPVLIESAAGARSR